MKPLTKILLTLSMCLMFLGCVVVVGAYIVGGMSLSKLDVDTKYEEKEYKTSLEGIEDIVLKVDKHDVVLVQTEDTDELRMAYLENEYDRFETYQLNGKLYISNKVNKNIFRRLYCLLFDRKNKTEKCVTITLPKSYEADIRIENSEGNVSVNDIILLDTVAIDATKGDVEVNSSICSKLEASVKTGIVTINGGIISDIVLSVSNEGKYVNEEEETEETPDPSATLNPDETPSAEQTPEPTAEPTMEPTPVPTEEPTTEPEVTPDASENPEATPEATVEPTETPKVLVVEKQISVNKVDFKNLKIVASYTNIKCETMRNRAYFDINFNGNAENCNIEDGTSISSLGTIDISHNGGAVDIYFK